MFNQFFKKEKPRVYLGLLAIVPRNDFKRHFEQWGLFKKEDLETHLHEKLVELFSLPEAKENKDPKNSDLVLDVIVPKFQSGSIMAISLNGFAIPFLWRPKLTISARLYSLVSKKTKYTFSVNKKVKLRDYLKRLFKWQSILGLRPLFDSSDIEMLLYQACHKLLLKIEKTL